MLQNNNIAVQQDKALTLLESIIQIPDDYALVNCLLLNHDDQPIFVFRYEHVNGVCKGLGGEHFSVSIDLAATKVMGFMHIEKQHCGPGLPTDDVARQLAIEFLPQVAADLVDSYEIKWIMRQLEEPNKIPHESPFPFRDENDHKCLVTGVRVKFFFEKLGAWGWVIVGRNNKVIAFEREIIWSTTLNRRSTPAWLHDNFVEELVSELGRLK